MCIRQRVNHRPDSPEAWQETARRLCIVLTACWERAVRLLHLITMYVTFDHLFKRTLKYLHKH